jgi:4-hydroxy-2-oxoheptanedioate aldolase
MKRNRAKEKLAKGEPVFKCMVLSNSPAEVEVLGYAGFDIVCFDGEHAPLDRQTLENLVRAAESVGVTPIFRSALHYPAEILPYLDTGAMGVMIPHCSTAAKARMAVEAVKYTPLGRRGMTPARAAAYGVSGARTRDYIADSNRETMIVAQIEDREALENLDELLKVDEIDIFDISPSDLSASLGYPGEPSHPKVLEVTETILEKAHAAGRITVNNATDAETLQRWFDLGAHVITLGDLRLLFDGAVAEIATYRGKLVRT